jgi:DNA invertase Pin-like site-specific DNA recombinase
MPTVPEPVVAASYERVSTRAQGQTGFSLAAQSKDAAAFAGEHGWLLPEHLRFRDGEDRHASGADWDLPGLNAMLDAARRREFALLLVPTVDRFARDMTKALVLEQQLRKHGVRVVYLTAPVEDTAEGRLLLRQLQSFAEFERDKIAFRTMRGRREKIARGLVLGSGPVPYGYRYVKTGDPARVERMEVDPATAPIVARIFSEALRRSAIDIADRLNADGVKLPRGSRSGAGWRQYHVLRILTNPTYCGRVLYGAGVGRARAAAYLERSGEFASVAVPALVSPALWQQVQEATACRHEVRGGARKPGLDPFLLRGLLTCGHCGGQLSAKWNVSGSRQPYRQYHCIRSRPFVARRLERDMCPMRDVHAGDIEASVWAVVTGVLADPARLRAGIEWARTQHQRAAAALAERQKTIEREQQRARARIERIIDELLETPKGTASYRALVDRQRDAERVLAKLSDESAALEAGRTGGLSDAAADELERIAEAMRASIDVEDVPRRRELLEHLQLRGAVSLDRHGSRFGRKHRYRIELQAAFDLNLAHAVIQQGSSTVLYHTLFELDSPGARLRIALLACMGIR